MLIGIASTHSPSKRGRISSVDERFAAAAAARGAEPLFIDPLDCSYEIDRHRPRIFLHGQPLALDGLLVRRAAHHWNATKTLVLVAHELDVRCLDGPGTFIGSLSGKFQALLRRYQLPSARSPRSFLYFRPESVRAAPPPPETFPLLRKPLRGSLGEGIVTLHSPRDLARYLVDFDFTEPLMLQQRIAGTEYRVLMLGQRCLGVVKKHAAAGGLGNAAKGARFVRAGQTMSATVAELGARVMQVAPYDFAAIDLFRDENDESWILECNRNPHFSAFEAAVPEIDVATEVIDELMRRISTFQ